ncbi:MAG: SAM-dependent methyltransferase [Planctomycetes bacterium]|nr:SAM-dependent methyltransferase [Planctomycetota bacterium]
MPAPTEWEFTADVAKWVQQALHADPSLPFSEAKCETRTIGSAKRSDLILLDKDGRTVLAGEVKLPWQPHAGTPFNEQVVTDARAKAKRAGVGFFFTWNVNQFVLWEVFAPKTARTQRAYRTWQVTSVHKEEHLYLPMTVQAIQTWLGTFLAEFARVIRGAEPLGVKRPDEQFTDALEAALHLPIALTIDELARRYTEPHQKHALDAWMRDDLAITITDDPEGIQENLDRAARFACYSLVNKLVFHEALLKRFGDTMERLSVPDHIGTGEALRLHLAQHFAQAILATHDYETVFGDEHASVGNRVPFYSDHAVPHWREIIAQIHEFDFSRLDYEVIGSLFERFISPEERAKFGQFYTRVEVVDLINSFCIRRGDERVLDPSCGGGTFLVRAYARKREMAPTRSHAEVLSDLFGVDISPFATHLTTINLATRDLIEKENYPQVARSDFFDVEATRPLRQLPMPRAGRMDAKGMGKGQQRNVWVPRLDAVVGNPPYIRQEEIPRSRKARERGLERGTKDYYLDLVKRESGAVLSGRSDIHCYFWPHAASFLKDDGWLCLITSSQWLDVEYGFRLQEWMLRNFEIIAVLESVDEPWFVGARVATAVTILRRQKDEAARMANIARFVQLRRPIRDLLAHDGTAQGAMEAANAFRDEILALTHNAATDRFRARLVPQAQLWQDGVQLGVLMGKFPSEEEAAEGSTAEPTLGKYYGGKWGVHLRAPDLWFELLDRYGARLVPLAQVAEVRFGVKSGKDCFFLPRDASRECLREVRNPREFHTRYGVARTEVQAGKIRIVACGEGYGERMPVEAEFLEPEVHSLMEVDAFTVSPSNCAHLMLLAGRTKRELRGTHVLRYIEWGEERGFDQGATCAGRVTADRPWYDLTCHKRGKLFWPKAQHYKHVVPLNPRRLQCNANLYDVYPPVGMGAHLLGGILNSTFVALSKYQFGRPVGVEGDLKTEIVDVNMMLVPDPRRAPRPQRERVSAAFRRLAKRKVCQLLSERRLRRMAYLQAGREADLRQLPDLCELDMADRRELDDAVLEMMGESSPERRKELIDRLYAYLREFFEQVRQKEEKAIESKKRARRHGPAKPSEIAAEILEEIKAKDPSLLQNYDPGFLDPSRPCDTYELPAAGEACNGQTLFVAHGVAFMKGRKTVAAVETKNAAQDALIVLLARSGVRGLVRVPHDEAECQRVYDRYSDLVGRREARVRELIQLRTADEDAQGRIYDALMRLLERGNSRLQCAVSPL